MSIMLTMTTMTTPTLEEFLLARIAEDERMATPVQDHPMFDGTGIMITDYGRGPRMGINSNVAAYMARFDPARVLAECEAKRRIVKLVSDVKWTGSYAVRDEVLETVALPYADHPDYLPEWRP
jgi:Family of unknown function (DUF6221)